MLRSPIRWAGSKNQLLSEINKLFPNTIKRYYEPMVGGGAVFFSNDLQDAFLADQNEDLINYYIVLKNFKTVFIDQLMSLKSSKDKYYEFRESRPIDNVDMAVRFAYLNRLSWNGVYRVNSKGDFNVPFGGRTPKNLWSRDHLIQCSNKLQNSELACKDFIESKDNYEQNDLVFIDPPYPKGAIKGVGFNRYNSEPFSFENHIQLSQKLITLNDKNVKILLTLGDNEQILNLYPSCFYRKKIITKSLISCNGDSRGESVEYVLRNYKN